MFQQILVPLDGTDVAEGILPYVSQIARSADIPVLLHTVVDPDAFTLPVTSEGEKARAVYGHLVEDKLKAHAEAQLGSIVLKLADEGVEAKAAASAGNPAEEILRVAEEAGCGLIAMSTHGRNVIGRGILGSVTDKVAHSADVPVLTITPEKARAYHGKEGMSLSRVILPLDGSELAEQAQPYAQELARTLALEEVVLVEVVGTAHLAYAYPEAATTLPNLTEGLVQNANEYLDGVAQGLEEKGLTTHTHVLQGSPAASLVAFVEQTPQSIIVMTTRGRSGLTRWVMGSVTEALVRASGDPVLIIPSRLSAR